MASSSGASSPQPPRPCEAYRAEWKLCRSAGHFLHHYYVHGERPDCEQWRRDLDSCREWEDRRSTEAQVRPGSRGLGLGGGAELPGRVAGASECTDHSSPRFRSRDSGEGFLFLCIPPLPEKYQKSDYQLDFQTLKDKEESGKWFGERKGPLTVLGL